MVAPESDESFEGTNVFVTQGKGSCINSYLLMNYS